MDRRGPEPRSALLLFMNTGSGSLVCLGSKFQSEIYFSYFNKMIDIPFNTYKCLTTGNPAWSQRLLLVLVYII